MRLIDSGGCVVELVRADGRGPGASRKRGGPVRARGARGARAPRRRPALIPSSTRS